MKDMIRILGITLVTAIYCYAVSTVTNLPVSTDAGDQLTTKHAQYLAAVSNNLYCQTSQLESRVSSSHFSLPVFKNPFNKLWSVTKTIEQLFEAELAQYFNFSINFLIQHRKTDIIYPFHYFW